MTSGSDLDQFMQQPLVPVLFGMTCFFGILLIVMIVLIIYLRQRRAAKERAEAAPSPSFATVASEHEMPDLDSLVSTPDAVPLSQLVPAPSPAQAPSPARPVRKGTFNIHVQDGTAAEAVEVMVVMRDVVDGRLIVQMGDKAFENIKSSPDFADRFNRVMRELGQNVTTSSAPSLEQVVETRDDVSSEADGMETDQPAPISEPPPPPPPKPKLTSAPPPIPASGVLPGDLPSFKLADNPMVRPKRGQKLNLKPVPEINIAGAIESYLQYRLAHTPEYQGRSIHIYPAPDGGVSIEVDGQYYEAVSDIADSDVREFVAQSIQEWQERH